jgi:hypothetical protein
LLKIGFRTRPLAFSFGADEAIRFRFPPICASPQESAETFPQVTTKKKPTKENKDENQGESNENNEN